MRDIIGPSGAPLDVLLQDQTTKPFDIRLNKVLNEELVLAEVPTVDTYVITLEEGHGITAGDTIALLSLEDGEINDVVFSVLSVDTNVITLDTPVPYAFPIDDTEVVQIDTDMAVDGSTTKQVFQVKKRF